MYETLQKKDIYHINWLAGILPINSYIIKLSMFPATAMLVVAGV